MVGLMTSGPPWKCPVFTSVVMRGAKMIPRRMRNDTAGGNGLQNVFLGGQSGKAVASRLHPVMQHDFRRWRLHTGSRQGLEAHDHRHAIWRAENEFKNWPLLLFGSG